MNILEFAQGFLFEFTSVQKVLLKLLYSIPLTKEKVLFLEYSITGFELWSLSEIDYVNYLRKTGRLKGSNENKVLLLLGRKSGKSTIGALVLAFEVYSQQKVSGYFLSIAQIECFCKASNDLFGTNLSLRGGPLYSFFSYPSRERGISKVDLMYWDEIFFGVQNIQNRYFEQRELIISSPNNCKNFWDQYSGLAINLPTWHLQPSLPLYDLRNDHFTDLSAYIE